MGGSQKTVLIVDDEPKITTMISDYLESLGYNTVIGKNGKEALDLLVERHPDCLILDVMMPGIDGMDVTRRAREISSVPILMLTAKGRESDKLMGLEIGADDYMVKPFSMKELAARVRALIRRSGGFLGSQEGASTEFHYGDFTVSADKQAVYRQNIPLDLTAAQFKIAEVMFKNPGKVFTRIQLLESFQDMAFEGYERTIDVHIKNLRKIIEKNPAKPEYILTVWGSGYKAAELPEQLE